MKSNKLYRLLTVVMLLSITIGCQDDLLETYPKDKLSSATFWQTEKDAVNAVNALYPYLPGYSEVDWDRMSDVGHTNTPSQATATIEKGEHNAALGYFESKWSGAYEAIRAANYLLENIDEVKENDPTLEDEMYNRLKSEARFIRAFFYVRLTMLFGDVPLITNTINIETGQEVARDPQEQIWDFVDTEFTEMADGLPTSYSGNDIGRITKGAALAMEARAMLYAGRWQKAAAAAEAVMGLGYSLYPSYENLFSYDAQNNEEVILDRQRAKDVASVDFFNDYAPVGLKGYVGINATATLVEAFETTNGMNINDDPAFDPYDPYANRDPRLRYSLFIPTFSDDVPGDVLFNGEVYDPRPGSGTPDEVGKDFYRTKTGFTLKKYINEEDMNDRDNSGTNFIMLRYAEVLLTYAEAKIEANQIDGTVYDAINEVRQRPDVNMPVITQGKSRSELREVVRHERMVELALEGLRFFDIRRWGIAEDVMQGVVRGMNYIPVGGTEIKEYSEAGVVRSFNPERDYLFPVPQEEVTLNPNLKPNNNGY